MHFNLKIALLPIMTCENFVLSCIGTLKAYHRDIYHEVVGMGNLSQYQKGLFLDEKLYSLPKTNVPSLIEKFLSQKKGSSIKSRSPPR